MNIRLSELKQTNREKYDREIERKRDLTEQKFKYKKDITQYAKMFFVTELQDGVNTIAEYHNTNPVGKKLAFDIKVMDYKDAIKVLMSVNLFTFLGINVKRGQNFLCPIMANNLASINYDKEGNWRYFTRDGKSTEGYVLGIIDIVEIVYNLNYFQAVSKLCDMLLINVENDKWFKNQLARYSENKKFICKSELEMSQIYPVLFKYIRRHLYLLEELNTYGANSVTSEEKSVNGADIFFLSSRYLEKRLEVQGIKKSYTNINKLLNMFTVLGLVIKVPLNQVPDRYQKETNKFLMIKSSEVVKDYQLSKKHCHPISFYQIPLMTPELLFEAQRRVFRLKAAGIKATGVIISNKDLKKTIGDNLHDSLFKEKIAFVKGIEKAKKYKKELEENRKRNQEHIIKKETSSI